MKYSKNQKLAKDFLRWVHKPDNYSKWFQSQEALQRRRHQDMGEQSRCGTKVDPPLKMFRTAAQNTRLFGYAGPSTAKSTEAFTKYIITDMYAKGVQGMKAEDAVRWAEGELKKIYESGRRRVTPGAGPGQRRGSAAPSPRRAPARSRGRPTPRSTRR